MLRINYFWLLIVLIALINAVAALFFISNPSGGTVRTFIAAEDGILENLTVSLFLFTFLFSLVLLATRQVNGSLNRRWLYLLLAIGLLGFLEEISYGERLFDLKMPVVYGVKIDALHDLIDVALLHGPSWLMENILLSSTLGLFFLAALGLLLKKYSQPLWDFATAAKYRELFLVMIMMVVFAGGAVILDMEDHIAFKGQLILEESFEFNFALALAACCFIIYKIDVSSEGLPGESVAEL